MARAVRHPWENGLRKRKLVVAMRWARTLILAHMLIRTVRENVAREAVAQVPELQKENPMNDDAMANSTPNPAPSPAPGPTPGVSVSPSPPSQTPVGDINKTPVGDINKPPVGDINTILTNAASLAQALEGNPDVLAFMNALMAAAKPQNSG